MVSDARISTCVDKDLTPAGLVDCAQPRWAEGGGVGKGSAYYDEGPA